MGRTNEPDLIIDDSNLMILTGLNYKWNWYTAKEYISSR